MADGHAVRQHVPRLTDEMWLAERVWGTWAPLVRGVTTVQLRRGRLWLAIQALGLADKVIPRQKRATTYREALERLYRVELPQCSSDSPTLSGPGPAVGVRDVPHTAGAALSCGSSTGGSSSSASVGAGQSMCLEL
jgi:hypothetical protein